VAITSQPVSDRHDVWFYGGAFSVGQSNGAAFDDLG